MGIAQRAAKVKPREKCREANLLLCGCGSGRLFFVPAAHSCKLRHEMLRLIAPGRRLGRADKRSRSVIAAEPCRAASRGGDTHGVSLYRRFAFGIDTARFAPGFVENNAKEFCRLWVRIPADPGRDAGFHPAPVGGVAAGCPQRRAQSRGAGRGARRRRGAELEAAKPAGKALPQLWPRAHPVRAGRRRARLCSQSRSGCI